MVKENKSSRTKAQTVQDRQNSTPRRESEKGDSQATTLVSLAASAEKFHDGGGEAYARIDQDGHREVWRIGSKAFKNWLQRKYWMATNTAPNSQALQDAIGVLRGQACYEGPLRETAVRISGTDDCIWIDLANEEWQAIRIDANGWQVVDNPDVTFLRPRGVLPLPTPVRGGSLDELREFINVSDDADFMLIIAWLVAALRPRGPYPVLSINGEQGSAKTTLCRIVRSLIDPNKAGLRSAPKDERDLMIAGSNGHIVALENLSKIPDWLSDALCRLSTGGGFGTRELFSDGEEKLFEGQRPVLLNGITELCTRSDLLDRAICVSLSAIPENKRTTESALWARFESIRGRILGALLDAVSHACAAQAEVRLTSLPRMADFATWVVAAEPALPWKPGAFLCAYQGNRAIANESAIESSILSGPLFSFMEGRNAWEGTATDLKSALEQEADERVVKSKDWPKKAHFLSGEIKRIAPNLRRSGLDVEFGKESGKRFIRIMRTAAHNSVQSDPSVHAPENDGAGSTHMDDAGRSLDAQNDDGVFDSFGELHDRDAPDEDSQDCSEIDFTWLDESHL